MLREVRSPKQMSSDSRKRPEQTHSTTAFAENANLEKSTSENGTIYNLDSIKMNNSLFNDSDFLVSAEAEAKTEAQNDNVHQLGISGAQTNLNDDKIGYLVNRSRQAKGYRKNGRNRRGAQRANGFWLEGIYGRTPNNPVYTAKVYRLIDKCFSEGLTQANIERRIEALEQKEIVPHICLTDLFNPNEVRRFDSLILWRIPCVLTMGEGGGVSFIKD
ncbi:MAG: hypothetical protein LBO72_00115 [Helicobacteraceae bacterium]|jgi:hypothetical protein|nr:hypothetical protein [Helicobacteraceae bacterium]